MRNLHRWIMTIMVVFLIYWGATGLLLQVTDMTDTDQRWSTDSGEYFTTMMRGRDPALSDAQWQTALAQAQQSLTAELGNVAVISVELRSLSGATPLIATLADGRQWQFTASHGSSMVPGGMGGVSTHDIIKTLHRGNVVGLPGVILAGLCGVALCVLSVTGISMYLRLRGSAIAAGRWFWSQPSETIWRRWHRWVSLLSVVLILNTAISGALLAVDEISVRSNPDFPGDQYFFGVFSQNGKNAGNNAGMPPPMMGMAGGPAGGPGGGPVAGMGGGPGGGPGSGMNANDAPLPMAELVQWQQTSLSALRSSTQTLITQWQWRLRDGVALSTLVLSGGEQLAFDGRSGATLTSPAAEPLRFHQLLKAIHRGDLFGFNGRALGIASALALLYLSISSLFMYSQMRQRRLSTGRTGWFWQ